MTATGPYQIYQTSENKFVSEIIDLSKINTIGKIIFLTILAKFEMEDNSTPIFGEKKFDFTNLNEKKNNITILNDFNLDNQEKNKKNSSFPETNRKKNGSISSNDKSTRYNSYCNTTTSYEKEKIKTERSNDKIILIERNSCENKSEENLKIKEKMRCDCKCPCEKCTSSVEYVNFENLNNFLKQKKNIHYKCHNNCLNKIELLILPSSCRIEENFEIKTDKEKNQVCCIFINNSCSIF